MAVEAKRITLKTSLTKAAEPVLRPVDLLGEEAYAEIMKAAEAYDPLLG